MVSALQCNTRNHQFPIHVYTCTLIWHSERSSIYRSSVYRSSVLLHRGVADEPGSVAPGASVAGAGPWTQSLEQGPSCLDQGCLTWLVPTKRDECLYSKNFHVHLHIYLKSKIYLLFKKFGKHLETCFINVCKNFNKT